jgi:hypothetical protein
MKRCAAIVFLFLGVTMIHGRLAHSDGIAANNEWVWSQVLNGNAADFNAKCGNMLGPPSDESCRTLSGSFLSSKLTNQNAVSGVTRNGVRIINGLIEGDLDLSNSAIPFEIELRSSTIRGRIILDNARIDGAVTLDESYVTDSVLSTNCKIERLEVFHSKFNKQVSFEACDVDKSVSIGQSNVNNNFAISNAHVGSLTVVGGRINSGLVMNGLRVDGDLGIDQAIDYVLGESLKVSGNVRIRVLEASDPGVVMSYSKIAGNLYILGQCSYDLTGSTVDQALDLSDAQWNSDAMLTLHNVHVATIESRQLSWPKATELEGFTYDKIGARGYPETDTIAQQDVAWWSSWLHSDKDPGPQPYKQLAASLTAAGRLLDADQIQFLGREQERESACQHGQTIRCSALTLLNAAIGYGIAAYTFRSLGWLVALAAIGFVALRCSPAARAKGTLWCVGASFDRVIPVIHLNKEFEDFFNDPKRKRLRGWQLAVFAILAAGGWALGLFLIAAMTGLTQKP